MRACLRAAHCRGINTDSLGHYLCGLGLLSAVSRKWPSVRAAWRSGHLVLLGEGLTLDQIKHYLMSEWQPTSYERWWDKPFKDDRDARKKGKPAMSLRRARGDKPVDYLRSLDATVVYVDRPITNPLFGDLAGQLGAQRDFARVYRACTQFLTVVRKGEFEETGIPNDLIRYLKAFQKRQDCHDLLAAWLNETLLGASVDEIPPIGSTGTWFLYANKTFNTGQQWFRKGRLSPWSFLLALEGALLLVGGINRRLTARSRPYAVFPFICEPSQPVTAGEVGAFKAEFWAPLWGNPATLTEVRTLFQRGLARLGGRAAQEPYEFAVAARAAGVDAGVTEFVRFELRQTTSSQVYEAIPRQRIRVEPQPAPTEPTSQIPSDADLLMQLIESRWLDRLPYEPRDSRQRGKFAGLRGPVEAAIIDVSEQPDDSERWKNLLTLLARTQLRIDRNRSFRDRCIPLRMLHPGWFYRAWPKSIPAEVQIAQSIASVGSSLDYPLLFNVYGVDRDGTGRLIFPKSRPQRAVWHHGDPLRVLADVVHRRLIDVNPTDSVPLDASCRCPQNLVSWFLTGMLDVEKIARWVPPLALIDWSQSQDLSEIQADRRCPPPDGRVLLHALFRPFFHPGPVWINQNEVLFPKDRQPHAGLARRLFHLLCYGWIDEAIQAARNAYLAGGRSIVIPPTGLPTLGDHLAAALLIPIRSRDVAAGICRWFEPHKT